MKKTDIRNIVREAVESGLGTQPRLQDALGAALAVALKERLLNVQNKLTFAVVEEMGDLPGTSKPKFNELEAISKAAIETALRDEELRSALLDITVHALMSTFAGRS